MTASFLPDEHSVTIARISHDRVLRSPVGLVRAALRSRSRPVLDLLARAVTRGEHDLGGLVESLHDGDVPTVWFDSRRRAAFTCLLTALSTDGRHGDAALAGWSAMQRARGATLLGETAQLLLAQLSLDAGRDDLVRTVLATAQRLSPTVRHYLEVDLANPYRRDDPITVRPADHDRWEQLLGEPFLAAGLQPPRVSAAEATLFDGLSAPSSAITAGPLVSVIMPSYRPDAGLLTSVRSILGQSHAHLELIIVDDASGPDYRHWYECAAALDPRVQVLTLDNNGGTYPARNAGLRAAAGEYITFQDSDDWSHPERLRLQLRALAKDTGAVGSVSEAVRATDVLTHQWIGYPPVRRNASSLMIRREVLRQVGPFDPVRKSADSEFYERIQHAAGPVLDVPVPLAITRLRAGTLSRADFRYGWMHPERLLYREAYRHWHRTAADLRMPADGPRPFPAPASFLTPPAEREPVEVDVLLVTDLSAGGVDLVGLDALLDQAGAVGLTVGILHQEDALRAREKRTDLEPEVLERAARGKCELLAPTTPVATQTVVVPDPELLLTRRHPAPLVHTSAVLAMLRVPTTAEEVLDHLEVADAAESAFGRRPRWVTSTEADRAALTEDGFSGLGLLTEELALLAEDVGMIGEGAAEF